MREELGVTAWPDLLAVMQQSAPVAQISQLHGLQTYYGELDIRGGRCCSSQPAWHSNCSPSLNAPGRELSAKLPTTPAMLSVAGLLLCRGGQQALHP